MTSSGSISNVVPRPSHVAQAPYGELNEKLRGAGSSKLRPSTGHTRCWLNVSVSFVAASPSRRDELDLGHAVGQLERRLQRVGEPAGDALAQHEAVDDDLDLVLLVAGEALGRA